MSEWFASTGDEIGGKHGLVSEVLCELPPKPTQRVAEVLHGKQPNAASKQISIHGDDLRTFPALFVGEDVISRQRRLLALRTAAAKLERAFESFGRDRDRDDFQHLWDHFLAPHSPERLLGPRPTLPALTHNGDVASSAAAVAIPKQPHSEPSSVPSATSCAIPTLLLSTNGASMADRIDLYGAFTTYLRTQQNAYVALLRPEDLAGGVGGCFSSALAQLSGLPEAAAEDVMGLVAWYDHETGISGSQLPNSEGDAEITAAMSPNKSAAKTPAKCAKTPRKAPAKTPAKGAAMTPSKATRGTQGQGQENAGDVAEAQDMEAQEAPGTVAARLRARRGQAGEAAAAAAEAETRKAHEAAAAVAARNRRRHVVLLIESASRVCDRGALRALLAALHGERHRLPVVLVLGLSCPAALYDSKLPADMAALLQMTAAELAPHPLQLHRLFQDVLLAPAAPSAAAMLLDGATMRELLVQCRLLEPSLASLQTALLEAHEQHFRCEPLAPLALLPLTAHTQQQQKEAAAAAVDTAAGGPAANGTTPSRCRLPAGRIKAAAAGTDSSDEDAADDTSSGSSSYRSVASREVKDTAATCGGGASNRGGGGSQDGLVLDEAWLAQRRQQHMARLSAAVSELPEDFIRAAAAAAAGGAEGAGATGALRQQQQPRDLAAAEAGAVEAVAAAFSALSSWRLGLQWLAALAERTGALQQPGGQRYSLPALYVAAASPRFWRPAPSAAAAAAMLAAAARGAAADPGLPPSVGELLLGALLGGAAAGPGATLRNMSDQAVYRLLDELWELASEALRLDWMPSQEAMAAAKILQELRDRISQGPAAGAAPGDTAAPAVVAAGATGGGGGTDDQVSPLRQRLAAQGLTSPPTHKKLESITERLGRLDPLPAPKILQPNDAPPQEQQQPPQPAVGGPATRRKGAVVAGGIKLPSSGQTQTKSQRDKALKTVVQQRAAAGPASQPTADHVAAVSAGAAARSAADAAAEFLATTLRQLLGTCPFQFPGSSAFTFRDAAGLQRRLVGAPSLALHTYLTQPELALTDLQPGLHPGQEDAALAYQLLVGCREGVSLQDWLADYCAASGLGRMQEVQQEEEPEQDGGGEAEQNRPMGRSRHSQRRQAPRKRKAPPKQEVVLALDGPEAEAAVDALAARFEQAARELEAVGLCRFSKRRAGLYVHRTYYPPEVVA